jgi:hypothetical protein
MQWSLGANFTNNIAQNVMAQKQQEQKGVRA